MNREITAEDDLRWKVEDLTKELAEARAELDLCAAWLRAIRRIWKRWDDVLSVGGTPSCTQQADAWLAAREAHP